MVAPTSQKASSDNISKALAPTKFISAGIPPRYSSLNSPVLSEVCRSGKASPLNNRIQVTCWCTCCHRSFTNKDGWSKHETENHENHVFPCMLNERIENRGRGPESSICGAPDPDENYFNMHQLAGWYEKSVCGREFKRRGDLVNHLSYHGVPNGFELAERWKSTSDRKAWACGFCIKIFS